MILPINQIITGDCLEVMKDWPNNKKSFFPLTNIHDLGTMLI